MPISNVILVHSYFIRGVSLQSACFSKIRNLLTNCYIEEGNEELAQLVEDGCGKLEPKADLPQ